MTLKEAAIISCEDKIRHLEKVPKHHYGKRRRERAVELERVKIAALRPISREQVRKAWKGEWTQGGYACGEHEWECSKCHETEWRTSCSRLKFCPFCGAPMTDEAVDILLNRLEESKDGKTD